MNGDMQWGMDRELYAHQRSRSGSRHSPQRSRHSLRQPAPLHFPGQASAEAEQVGSTDDDLLSPLAGPTRKGRPRIDSMSSMGSSVAPAALPQHRTRRNTGTLHPVPRGERPSHGAVPSVQLATFDSVRSGLSDWQAQEAASASVGEGGLEAWLRSQAVAAPQNGEDGQAAANGLSEAAFRSFAPNGRVRRVDSHLDMNDAVSDAGRSVGARSAGPRNDGTGSRRSTGKHSRRAQIPDWEPSAIDADSAGLASGPSRQPESSSKGMRTWLEGDSLLGSERRGTRRELGPGTLSASGVRLRESVRRMNRSNGGGGETGGASLDALVSSSRDPLSPQLTRPLRGTISASPSMGIDSSIFSAASGQARPAAMQRDASHVARTAQKEAILGSPMRIWAKAMLMEKSSVRAHESASRTTMAAAVLSSVLFSILVKWAVGLGGWSGRGMDPINGDFEAQRHWIEITLHLPPSQWYFYDLQYWGLDYPPLTALVSRWCGKLASLFPTLATHFDLDSSRRSEAPELVVFMRATVLLLDVLVYMPAILFFLGRKLQGRGRRTRVIATLTVLLQPSTILIDHGHFQYNTVMLGFAAAAFAFLYTSLPNPDMGKSTLEMRKRMKSLSRQISYEYITAAVFFSLSLCFKQMALYYAPAVFAVMLGRCVGLARIGFERGLICLFGIGLATTLTFGFVFRFWLTDMAQLAQVIHRIFPVARGIFEDKVSSVWCFLSVLPLPARYKLKNALSVDALARLSVGSTLLAVLLPCAHLFAAAAETVHIEMFLDEDSKRQVLASEKRQAEGSVVGSSSVTGRKPRHLMQAPPAPSEVGSDLVSMLGGRSAKSGVPGSALGRFDKRSLSAIATAAPTGANARAIASSSPSPAASVLPYAMLSTSLAFFLFGFQTHEKSVLLPLLPMTLLISVKADEWGGGAGRTDWEWAVLMNNVALFSMWPLLQRDGLVLQYAVLGFGWNWAIGHRPFAGLTTFRRNFVAWLGAAVHLAMIGLHVLELILLWTPTLTGSVLSRYPDLFAVLNVLLTMPVFGVIWLWSIKRQLEVGFACGIDILGLQPSKYKKDSPAIATEATDRKKQ